ncbi:hypothetical protein NVP1012O_01, partial [Vibrio phage 1.012.O._10N.261.48.C12]
SDLVIGQTIKAGTVMDLNGKSVEFPSRDCTILSVDPSSIVVFDGLESKTINTWGGEEPFRPSESSSN